MPAPNSRLAVILLLVTAATVFAEPPHREDQGDGERLNVLLICVDDLRPALGCYGDPLAKTPHFDRLAESSVMFRRAYCQLPSCCPSRTSFLTGLRVETTRVEGNGSPHFRTVLPDHVTLPQHFKQHGYDCRELGKVFHLRDPVSWSGPKWNPEAEYAYPIYGRAETIARQRQIAIAPKQDDWWGHKRWIRVVSQEAADVADETLFDGQLARKAVELLDKPRNRPFFLAVGFFRPHLPFVAPQRYYDLHPQERFRLPAVATPPPGTPPMAVHASPELRSYVDVPKTGELTADRQLRLLQAYYACVSYVDAQIGLLLQAVEERGLRRNTIIALVSDHGYHLGDHGMWGKHTNFEEATRSVLLVSAPGIASAQTDGLVELVDLYPSLCELSGLPVPDGLEGVSFAPLMRAPGCRWKQAAFSQAAPRGVPGYSIRTDTHRYTEWRDGEVVAQELYDYSAGAAELRNLADAPQHAPLLRDLQARLQRGWRHALPPPPP